MCDVPRSVSNPSECFSSWSVAGSGGRGGGGVGVGVSPCPRLLRVMMSATACSGSPLSVESSLRSWDSPLGDVSKPWVHSGNTQCIVGVMLATLSYIIQASVKPLARWAPPRGNEGRGNRHTPSRATVIRVGSDLIANRVRQIYPRIFSIHRLSVLLAEHCASRCITS